MKVTFDMDWEQVVEMFNEFIQEREKEDPLSSLSLIFDRSDDDSEIEEPALFFCPVKWDVDFQDRVSLIEALQEFLDEHNDDEEFADQCDLARRLQATTREWIEQQRSKRDEQA
jgi:hypothetical protein